MQSKRIIISVAGVALFLLAGAMAMFVLPSESPNTPAKNQPDSSSSRLNVQNPPQSSINQPPQNSQPLPVQQSPQESPRPSKPEVWYIYVTGEVKKQGVYTVPAGSRIFQVIALAGGFTRNADSASLNLADFLADSAHIHIPAKNAKNSSKTAQAITPETIRIPGYSQQTNSRSGIRANTILVDVNSANLQELQRISGVGPAIAQRIIDYRNTHGAFTSIEDLQKVRGIGTKTMERIRPQVTVQGSITYSQKSQPSSGNTNLIDINHASQSELQRISGVGPAIAKRIIEYRNSHGSFSRVEDLLHVRGIGASKLDQIRSQVVIR